MAPDSAAVLATKRRRPTLLEAIQFPPGSRPEGRLFVNWLSPGSLAADAMHKEEPRQCIFQWTHRRSSGLTGLGCAGMLRPQKLCEIECRTLLLPTLGRSPTPGWPPSNPRRSARPSAGSLAQPFPPTGHSLI